MTISGHCLYPDMPLAIRGLWARSSKAEKLERQAHSENTRQPLKTPKGTIGPLFREAAGNSKSNDDSLSPELDPTTSIEDKILAFRTITTMLGRMQHRNEIRVDDTKSKHLQYSAEKKQLDIYRALATVAVRDVGVITVASDVRTQGSWNSGNHELSDTLVVLITPSKDMEILEVQEDHHDTMTNLASSPVMPHASEDSPGPMKKLTQFFTNSKNRYLTVTAATPSATTDILKPTDQTEINEPTIEDAVRPAKIQSESDQDLFDFLEKYP